MDGKLKLATLLLLFAPLGHAQMLQTITNAVTNVGITPPSLVQAKGCSGTSTPNTCTLASNMTAGNLAVVVAVANGGTCTSVTSTPSNTFQPWLVQTNGGSNRMTVFVARNVASGTNTLVATCTGATSFVSQMDYEYSNATAADVAGSTTGTGGTPTFTTIQPVGSSVEAVIASIFDNSNFRTWAAGSGFTIQAQVNQSGAQFLGASEDNNTKTGLSGTQSASITGVSTDPWTGSIITVSNVAGTQDAADVNMDFEGLSNGVKPTVSALQNSNHGVPLIWSIGSSTVFTGATGSQGTSFPSGHLMGATNWTGSGSLGLAYATGTATNDLSGTFALSTPSVSWIGQFKTDIPQNDTNLNAYTLTQLNAASAVDYLAPQLQANGSSLVMALECKTGPGSGTIAISTNTLYYLSLLAVNNSGTHTMKIYDSTGSQVGSTINCTAEPGATAWTLITFGVNGAEPESGGHVISWDNVRISLTGATLAP